MDQVISANGYSITSGVPNDMVLENITTEDANFGAVTKLTWSWKQFQVPLELLYVILPISWAIAQDSAIEYFNDPYYYATLSLTIKSLLNQKGEHLP